MLTCDDVTRFLKMKMSEFFFFLIQRATEQIEKRLGLGLPPETDCSITTKKQSVSPDPKGSFFQSNKFSGMLG